MLNRENGGFFPEITEEKGDDWLFLQPLNNLSESLKTQTYQYLGVETFLRSKRASQKLRESDTKRPQQANGT